MPNDLSTLARSCSLAIGVGLALAGCAAPTGGSRPPAAAAHISVVNLTDYRWRIEIAPQNGSKPYLELLEARRAADVDVPGGTYRIEQSIENPVDRPAASRNFTTQLTAGQIYHWPLATLQSDEPDDRAAPKPLP